MIENITTPNDSNLTQEQIKEIFESPFLKKEINYITLDYNSSLNHYYFWVNKPKFDGKSFSSEEEEVGCASKELFNIKLTPGSMIERPFDANNYINKIVCAFDDEDESIKIRVLKEINYDRAYKFMCTTLDNFFKSDQCSSFCNDVIGYKHCRPLSYDEEEVIKKSLKLLGDD
jgi:hypothetical protein